MKKNLALVLLILLLMSCEKKDSNVFLKIAELEYGIRDIELYDTSTHIMYFKKEHEELKLVEKGTFAFMNDGDQIYSGPLLPGYSSSIPSGPFIMTPPMYGNHALKIEFWHSDKPDPRVDTRLINILAENGLLHSGLAISASSQSFVESQLIFRFTITNQDQSDLLIIDPDKTGPNLFHYFTNGLLIYNQENREIFSGNISHESPEPWNIWRREWLSVLKSGDSKEYVITYPLSTPLVPGDYRATFRFPGLGHQVSLDQLYQSDGRIWLGDVSMVRRIHVGPSDIENK